MGTFSAGHLITADRCSSVEQVPEISARNFEKSGSLTANMRLLDGVPKAVLLCVLILIGIVSRTIHDCTYLLTSASLGSNVPEPLLSFASSKYTRLLSLRVVFRAR